jgi:hypothetical protein
MLGKIKKQFNDNKSTIFGAFVVVALIVIIGVVSAAYSKVNKGALPPPASTLPSTPTLPGTPAAAPVTKPDPPVPKKSETLEKIKAFFEKLFAKPEEKEDKDQIIYLRPNVKLSCNVV